MIPFGQRVEFGSAEWLAMGRSILATAAEAARPSGTADFSLSESFSGAPVHLGLPGDVASWHLRFHDGTASLIDGELAGADVTVTGDYHDVLPLAMTVYSDDGAEQRAWRENAHRVGADAVALKGVVADPAIARALRQFHNEMARRTIDNPNLASRIVGQRLERHAAEIRDQGYTILENAITPEYADELREAILALLPEAGYDSIVDARQAGRLLARGRLFEEAAMHPWMLTLMEQQCGKQFHMAQSMASVRGTGGGMAVHDDFIMMQEPFPTYSMAVTCIWALEDFDDDAGPTLVVPHSIHKRHHPPDNYAADPADFDMTPILMPKGSLALWDSATWHAARKRAADGLRVALHQYCCRIFVQPFEDYLNIDEAIVDRNPPVFSTLCGLDAPYRRNTEAGPDYDALNYSLAHYQS